MGLMDYRRKYPIQIKRLASEDRRIEPEGLEVSPITDK